MKILKSFCDIEDAQYFKSCEELSEEKLESLKQQLNRDIFRVLQVDDVRILSQLLLDYLESLKAPLLSLASLNKLEAFLDKLKKDEDQVDFEFIKEVDFGQQNRLNKNELALVTRILMFLKGFQCWSKELKVVASRLGFVLLGLHTSSKHKCLKDRYFIAERATVFPELRQFLGLVAAWIADSANSLSKSIIVSMSHVEIPLASAELFNSGQKDPPAYLRYPDTWRLLGPQKHLQPVVGAGSSEYTADLWRRA